MTKDTIYISHFTTVNALGRGVQASLDALRSGRSGLTPCDFGGIGEEGAEGIELKTWIGRVAGLEDEPVSGALSDYDCRNNRLAQMALQQDDFSVVVEQARQRYGSDRIGVFMGTSTSGIRQTELAYSQRDPDTQKLPADFKYETTHNTFSVARFTKRYLQLGGPALVISTACSSSAKVFATAQRYIQAGLCDAAIVGGVDSLCLTTLLGFNSLELVSPDVCRPWDEFRKGINIGEAAGFALLEKTPATDSSSASAGQESICLLGYGESSDAYHMSTPHPEGEGASLAMRKALAMAQLEAGQIDYVNLHGTSTRSNDSSEDAAVTNVLGTNTWCSSTKGWTGHTLGAAGIVESVFCFLSLQHKFVPVSLNTSSPDPALSARIVTASAITGNSELSVDHVMTNSFGFGGSNCCLVFGLSS